MSVKVIREDSNSMIRVMDSIEDAAAWILRLFTEHNWDAPRSVIKRSMEPDATAEEKAAARRLWPRYDPNDYHILADGVKHRVQRDGTVNIDPTTDPAGAVQGAAEGEGAVEGSGDPAPDAGAGESPDVQGDPDGEAEGSEGRGHRSSPTAVE